MFLRGFIAKTTCADQIADASETSSKNEMSKKKECNIHIHALRE